MTPSCAAMSWARAVIEAGEAYFVPSGHVLAYETDKNRCFELNPAHALKMCLDAMQVAVIKMGETAEAHAAE